MTTTVQKLLDEAASRLTAWQCGDLHDEPIDDVLQRIRRKSS